MDTPIVFIYLFLVITGAIAVLTSLHRTFNPPKNAPAQSDSSIETAWFKFRAPVGFVYGLVSILTVVMLVRSERVDELRRDLAERNSVIEALKQENSNLNAHLSAAGMAGQGKPFTVIVPTRRPKSVFEGTILVKFDFSGFGKSDAEFAGTDGVASTPSGPFVSGAIPIDQGDRLFIRLSSGVIWGVNVIEIDGSDGLTLEFFPTQSRQPAGTQAPSTDHTARNPSLQRTAAGASPHPPT